MQHLPVHWTEGLFLTAQHFQASERHWQELLFRSQQLGQAYYYGLGAVRYSAEAISNSSFQIDACEARSRRGALISFGEGSEPDRVSLHEQLAGPDALALVQMLAERPVVRVYLA